MLAPLRYEVRPVALAFGIWWLAFGLWLARRKHIGLMGAFLFIAGNAVLCAIFRQNFVSIAHRLAQLDPYW